MATREWLGPLVRSRQAGSAALTRLATLPTGAIASLVTASVALHHVGPTGYGAATILINLPLLLPFLDLGLGTAVLNSAADLGQRNDLRHTLIRSSTLLSAVAAPVFLLGVTLTLTDTWWLIVGPTAGPAFRIPGLIAVAAFAVTLPLGLGERLLLGLGRTSTVILIQALQPVLLAAVYATAAALGHGSMTWLMGALAISLTFSKSLAAVVGLRAAWPHLASDGAIRRTRGLSPEAAPAIVISAMTALTFQSGRWYLAHTANGEALASYALMMQIWAPLSSIAYAVGVSFWPAYRRAAYGRFSLWRRNLRFCAAAGAAVALLDLVAVPLAFRIVGRDSLSVPWAAAVALALALFVWIFHQPSAMLLTTPEGLRTQAFALTAMALTNGAVLLAFTSIASPLVVASALLFSMTLSALLPVQLTVRRQIAALERTS